MFSALLTSEVFETIRHIKNIIHDHNFGSKKFLNSLFANRTFELNFKVRQMKRKHDQK